MIQYHEVLRLHSLTGCRAFMKVRYTRIPELLNNLMIAISSWNQMWKRWFPSDKDPFEESFKLYKKWFESNTNFTFNQ